MQRGFGDSVGGGNGGQEDVGPRGLQSVAQDGDDLISWDENLSTGGASGNIPHLTEGKNSLPGPSLEEFKKVVRRRDLALHHFGEMLSALQQVSQAISKRTVSEPSPSHGRDSPCSWATGSNLKGVSESCVAAGELDPSGVGSYAPYIGSDETKGGNISMDKFDSGRARGSYLQPNVIPISEYRDNVGARREVSEYLELPSYEISWLFSRYA